MNAAAELEDLAPFAWDSLAGHDRGQRFHQVGFDAAVQALSGHRPLVYLASPYSKVAVDAAGRWSAVRSMSTQVIAAHWSSRLAMQGITAISPIILSAEMCALSTRTLQASDDARPDPLDAPFWTDWCFPLLMNCDAIVVPPIRQREASAGIWGEVVTALASSKPVYWIEECA